jgi:outer membrane biosynthesis protein TonB
LPARAKQKTAKNVIAKSEAMADSFVGVPTKVIDFARLVQLIALSGELEPTKQVAPALPPPPRARPPTPPPPPPRSSRSPTPPPPLPSSRPPTTPPPLPPTSPPLPLLPTLPASRLFGAEEKQPATISARALKVYSGASKGQRIIIGALATVFVGFVVATAWQLLSGGDDGEHTRIAAATSQVAAPPAAPQTADAAVAEVELDPELFARPDAGVAVASHRDVHPSGPPSPPTPLPPTPPPATDPPDAAAVVAAPPPETPAPDAAAPAPAVAAVEPGCDEASCVMSAYAEPCCARYKPKQDGFQPSTSVPDELTRAMVREAIAKVKPRVSACGDKTPAKGTVTIAVTVTGDGGVSEVTVVETPDPQLGSCVADAMHAVRFGKSNGGGSFNYSFVF